MDINDFIIKLEAEFEDFPKGSIQTNTSFKDIEGWSSMHILILVAMAEIEYGVQINGNDLKNAVTVGDLFEIIKSKSEI